MKGKGDTAAAANINAANLLREDESEAMKASLSRQSYKSRRLKNSQSSEKNYYQVALMNLECSEQDDSEYSYIWAQAKTLEYMAMSML